MRRLANVLVALIFAPSNALAGSLFPSDFDQYLLELTNRARRDPAGEAARYGISLNEGLGFPLDPSPRAPLSFDLHLVEAAMAHSRDMLDHNFFGHVSSDGKTAEDRARIAGYRAIAGIAENISWQGNTLAAPELAQAVDDVHRNLFVDTAQPGRGHRLNLLNSDVKEVGYGLATGDWTTGGFTYKSVMVTEDFTKSSLSPILTGVVYQDRDANNFYTPGGEGMAGVTIVAESPLGLTLQTATFPSGGYSLTLEPGPYHVTFQGSGIETQGFDVVVGRDNIKLDLPLLTSDSPNEAPWKNQDNALDVNADGLVEPLDVLLLVNQLNSSGGGELPELSDLASPPPFVDVSGDNVLAALDVLIVVNKLNSETSVLAPTPMLDLRAALSTTAVPEPTTGWLAAVAGALVCLRQLIRSRRKVA